MQGCADRASSRASGKVVALVGGRSYGAQPVQPRDAGPAPARAAPSSPSSTWPPSRPPSRTRACRRSRRPPSSRTRPRSSSTRTRSTSRTNYEDAYLGLVTLRRALAKSLNVATVKVAEMVGYERVAELWSKKLGIGAPIEPYPARRARVLRGDALRDGHRLQRARERRATRSSRSPILRVADEKGASSSSTTRPVARARAPRGVGLPRDRHAPERDATRARRRAPRADGLHRRGRGQDRHHQRLPRRLVRRLHAGPAVRRLGGLRRQHPGRACPARGPRCRSGSTS